MLIYCVTFDQKVSKKNSFHGNYSRKYGILLLLYLLGLHWHPVESYRKFQPGSILVEFIVNIYAFAPSHNSISKFQKNLVAPVGNKCAKKPIFSVKWLWPKLMYASDAVSYLHYCNAQHAHLGWYRVIISSLKQNYISIEITNMLAPYFYVNKILLKIVTKRTRNLWPLLRGPKVSSQARAMPGSASCFNVFC